ncbi:hypothetical protein [Bosea sp. RAC05]|uniref:hypothetical protein n=1 Tax=Bosea sp. RAC05 TaxID=1842539 RepID=UPI000857C5D8|nr:hypothetical protein [Bosea sp. RAC05]AOG03461.1 hypothetical protein BSY19_4717 [Bosea sp. RAC05]
MISTVTGANSPRRFRLFRGLALPKEDVDRAVETLLQRGHQPQLAKREVYQKRLSNRAEIMQLPRITLKDIQGSNREWIPSVCACGDEAGASHYAWKRSDPSLTPIMMEVEVPLHRLVVDGNDFLFRIFSRGIPELAGPYVERMFGPAAMSYARRAWSRPRGDEERMALCELAILDPEVVAHHHANSITIKGGTQTVFASAFTIRLPLEANEIVRVWQPTEPAAPSPETVDLNHLIDHKDVDG